MEHKTLKEIVDIQRRFDEGHGFSNSNKYSKESITGVALALFGECGELANIIKKYIRSVEAGGKDTISERGRRYMEEAREELADIFSFILKMAMVLDADLEEEYFKKLEKNKKKFKDFEK